MLVITRASIIIVGESINGDSLIIIDDIVTIILVINIDDSHIYFIIVHESKLLICQEKRISRY